MIRTLIEAAALVAFGIASVVLLSAFWCWSAADRDGSTATFVEEMLADFEFDRMHSPKDHELSPRGLALRKRGNHLGKIGAIILAIAAVLGLALSVG